MIFEYNEAPRKLLTTHLKEIRADDIRPHGLSCVHAHGTKIRVRSSWVHRLRITFQRAVVRELGATFSCALRATLPNLILVLALTHK